VKEEFEFCIGDFVEVTNEADTYPKYTYWAELRGLNKFVNGKLVSNGSIGKIVKVGLHPSYKNKHIYGILNNDVHYIVSGDSIKKSDSPVIDRGEDLIGRKFDRGGACVYKFTRYCDHLSCLKFTWHNGENKDYNSVKYCRKKLASGDWTLKPVLPPRVEKACTRIIALAYFNFLSDGNWSYVDILDLHVKTVNTYLHERGIPTTDALNICNRVKEISRTKLSEITVDSDLLPSEFNQEENTMKTENTIDVKVPTTPYAETTIVTMYGRLVDEECEEDLFNLLEKVEAEQLELKRINKTAKSTRVEAKIAALGSARDKIVAMLDALPKV
jgi:hypothetical protein